MRASELYVYKFFYINSRHKLEKQTRCEIIYKRTEKYYLHQIGPVPVTLEKADRAREVITIVLNCANGV